MPEYVVDSIGAAGQVGRNWDYVGDAPDPTKEPETHYFKKPVEEKLLLRIRAKADEGWRLISTSALYAAVYLFFERE